MNKFAKASIATGAVVLLLLGGAGTLAYWNDQADLSGASIEAGELKLEASECTWTAAPALWVPGDSASCDTTLTLTAAGDNIRGKLGIDESSIVVDSAAAADQFRIDIAAGTNTGTGSFDPATMEFTGPGAYVIPVTVTIDFPFIADAEQNESQNAEIDLDGVEFTATQTAP